MHKFFAINKFPPGRRFFEIARRLAELGYQVTVITSNSELDLPLGEKRTGLLQKEGVAIIALNPSYSPFMKKGLPSRESALFARQTIKQCCNLPTPDLVLASSPPPALAGAAYRISSLYKVPLVLDVRKTDGTLLCSRNTMAERVFHSQINRNVAKAYWKASWVVVPNSETAGAAAKFMPPTGRIAVLTDELDYEELFIEYGKIFNACFHELGEER